MSGYEGWFGATKPGASRMVRFVLVVHWSVDPRCGQKKKNPHREIIIGGLGGALSRDKTAPRFMALVDDLRRVFLVLRLSRECKCIFRLAIGNLVDPAYNKYDK